MDERSKRNAALRQADRSCDLEGLPAASPEAVAAEESWLDGSSAEAVVTALKKRFSEARESESVDVRPNARPEGD